MGVCVCFLPIHSGLQWTYQPGSHRKKVTGFSIHLLSAVLALIFLARRIQPFISLVDREVEFCVLTIYSFSTRWAFLFSFFSFSVRKIPFAGIELTSQRVTGYMVPLSYRGVASQNSTLPSAIIRFPISLLLSSPGDV